MFVTHSSTLSIAVSQLIRTFTLVFYLLVITAVSTWGWKTGLIAKRNKDKEVQGSQDLMIEKIIEKVVNKPKLQSYKAQDEKKPNYSRKPNRRHSLWSDQGYISIDDSSTQGTPYKTFTSRLNFAQDNNDYHHHQQIPINLSHSRCLTSTERSLIEKLMT